ALLAGRLRLGGDLLAVVLRLLLVEQRRQVALLEELLELAVELLRLQAEGVLDRLGHVVGEQALAELPQEVANPLRPVALLYEIEGGLSVPVDQEVDPLHPVDRRDEPV